jgi:hypothetical protein
VDIKPVDPRDTRWEVGSPAYRVYFWTPQPPPPDLPEHPGGYRSSEFELTNADVTDVLAWAQATATRGSTYTVYAVVEQNGEKGLVRLSGTDPTTG